MGELDPGCTAKDVILHILWRFAAESDTLDRSMEFGGPGLASLSMDERATLCNMATECSAKTGICEADDVTVDWLLSRRENMKKRISGVDLSCLMKARSTMEEFMRSTIRNTANGGASWKS